MKNRKIAILTDSCSDIPERCIFKYHIYTIPMLINCKDGEYKDRVTIHSKEVYERLRAGEIPKTSTPLGADIERMFNFLKKKGYESVLAIMMSSGISSTVQAVTLAADDCGMQVCVLDSLTASIGCGALAIQAAKWRDEGMEFKELCRRVKELRPSTIVFFSVDTLEYLMKGGRIGKVAALAGTALNIKPILSLDADGVIYSAAKVRGSKLVTKKLISLVEEQLNKPEFQGRPYNLMVADGGAPEERIPLENQLKEKFPDYVDIYGTNIGATLSVYIGDGILGAGIQFL